MTRQENSIKKNAMQVTVANLYANSVTMATINIEQLFYQTVSIEFSKTDTIPLPHSESPTNSPTKRTQKSPNDLHKDKRSGSSDGDPARYRKECLALVTYHYMVLGLNFSSYMGKFLSLPQHYFKSYNFIHAKSIIHRDLKSNSILCYRIIWYKILLKEGRYSFRVWSFPQPVDSRLIAITPGSEVIPHSMDIGLISQHMSVRCASCGRINSIACEFMFDNHNLWIIGWNG
ncbi:hypothetical protein KUTeg_021098 [Tegillarca granosa]|uniref:Uncharacterized protein n=1 Tax=Tegillarca granosa TaxID=220873 RepID=A0ABQ9EE35_TEGGR|nr:hypothetical protein KUTeg_021098 [Tegillarca granosa]